MNHELRKAIEGAMLGDVASFATLIALKQKDILFISAHFSDPSDIEDCAQEAAYRILRDIKTLRRIEYFDTWMYAVIRNTCYAQIKGKKKNLLLNNYMTADEAFEEDRIEFLPHEYAEDQEKRELILSIIKTLPIHYQDCLIMHYYQQKRCSEIADQLGISIAKVKNNLFRARAKVRKALKKRTGEPLPSRENAYGALSVFSLVFETQSRSFAHSSMGENLVRRAYEMAFDPVITKSAAPRNFLDQKKYAVTIMSVALAALIVTTLSIPQGTASAPTKTPPVGAEAAIVRENSGVLSGQVFIYSGQADTDRSLSGIKIEARSATGDMLPRSTRTGSCGEFSFDGLPKGSYRLYVNLPPDTKLRTPEELSGMAHVYAEDRIFTLDDDTVRIETLVVLNAPATVDGVLQVGLNGNEGIHSGRLRVRLIDSAGNSVSETGLEPDGAFHFPPLMMHEPGVYTIRVVDEEGQPLDLIPDTETLLYPGYRYGQK